MRHGGRAFRKNRRWQDLRLRCRRGNPDSQRRSRRIGRLNKSSSCDPARIRETSARSLHPLARSKNMKNSGVAAIGVGAVALLASLLIAQQPPPPPPQQGGAPPP